MARYVAFLRAINVGARVVKMEQLRRSFEELGLTNVETLIASGNVIFDSRASAKTLEERIEKELRKALGYEVVTFVRSNVELAPIAVREAFSASDLETPGSTLFIAFLRVEPPVKETKRLIDAPSAVDAFHFHGRELYWLCRTRASESEFSGARLEKLLGMRTTVRNVNTIRRLVAKFPPPARIASS